MQGLYGVCAWGFKWQDVIGTVNAIPVGRVLKIFFIFFFFYLHLSFSFRKLALADNISPDVLGEFARRVGGCIRRICAEIVILPSVAGDIAVTMPWSRVDIATENAGRLPSGHR